MPEYHRENEGYIPSNVKWVMKFINNIGFPIIVCMWLAYQQYTHERQMIASIDSFKEVLASLKLSVDQQTEALKRRSTRYD